jgi:hypothetical protein
VKYCGIWEKKVTEVNGKKWRLKEIDEEGKKKEKDNKEKGKMKGKPAYTYMQKSQNCKNVWARTLTS